MNFEELIEQIQFELILEGIGVIFGFYLLWQLFFDSTIQSLMSLFITTIC